MYLPTWSEPEIIYIVNRRELVALFNKLTGKCRKCKQCLLISLESGEVRNFQDIRDATSARLEITFLDAHAAAYVLNLTIMNARIILSRFPL